MEEAWVLAERDSVGGLSLGALAKAVGMRQPSLYTYFDSKLDLYDAMFADANRQLWDAVLSEEYSDDPRAVLKQLLRAILRFCSAHVAHGQLLFQRPVPTFEPSAESYALAVRLFDWVATKLEAAGVTRPEDIDIFTAIAAGCSHQQMANDPGGDRWVRRVDPMVDMFLDHVLAVEGSKP